MRAVWAGNYGQGYAKVRAVWTGGIGPHYKLATTAKNRPERAMPKMSDSRRKKIQLRQRNAENALRREKKAERRAKKADKA